MKFTTIPQDIYEDFVARQQRVMFTQLPAYKRTREASGAKVEVLGVVEETTGKVYGLALASYQTWSRLFYRINIVYGPVFADDAPDSARRLFYTGLKAHARRNPRVISARITPPEFRRPYDDVTPGDELASARELDRTIADLGGHRVVADFVTRGDIPITYSYMKQIGGMDFPAIQKSTGQQVRTAFNRWGTNGVEVRFVGADRIDILGKVLEHTAERTEMSEISPGQLAYYKQLVEQFGPENAFLPVAVLHCTNYLTQIHAERVEIEGKVADLTERARELEAAGKALGKKQKNQRKELEDRLAVLGRREDETRSVQAAHGDEVVLAASLFVRSRNELLYLVSGAYAEFTSYYGIYLIHRAMFEWAAAHGVQWYNFYGISGDFSDTATDAGVLHFKRQFIGDVEEFVGTYDLPIRPRLAKALKALD
ncbi:peptidoglycan bridge formation glycyltransferase FemA/FemB family protein [Trueperella pecoris]|uniref:Peptidoglycan bridge formation glycyltransferase FemA/FemB family protein n=1 Tax=Trueperella pecoris TaxID=2733571 RepID=A0A7M1R3D4_9ACTO|nr:peptidoglycan bridge formation glycyltransferase FemA/FemB family protein [Trueperella pecoris]QOR48007.1 peptidoglycan bridge formation glycyltransferase FemA/FemB family protein [Trueperella pecoris]